jgi:hypothetical protein
MPKPLGVVYVLVAGEASKDGLPEQPCQGVPPILACSRVGQNIARHVRQSERVVEFAVGQQASVGGHDRSAKLQHQAAIEIKPQSAVLGFTRRVRHRRLAQRSITL